MAPQMVDTAMGHIGFRCAWPTTPPGVTGPPPSWRPEPTRDAMLAHVDDLDRVPVDESVAYLDDDGTMLCEKPADVQLGFFVDALRTRTTDDPCRRIRPELTAVLDGDIAYVAAPLGGIRCLVAHDESDRGLVDEGTAASSHDGEPSTTVEHRLGWTVVGGRGGGHTVVPEAT